MHDMLYSIWFWCALAVVGIFAYEFIEAIRRRLKERRYLGEFVSNQDLVDKYRIALKTGSVEFKNDVDDLHDALAALAANGDEPTIPWEDVKRSLDLEDAQVGREFVALVAAVRSVYYAAHWEPDRPVPNAKQLWERLRDAAGLEPGFAPAPIKPKAKPKKKKATVKGVRK